LPSGSISLKDPCRTSLDVFLPSLLLEPDTIVADKKWRAHLFTGKSMQVKSSQDLTSGLRWEKT